MTSQTESDSADEVEAEIVAVDAMESLSWWARQQVRLSMMFTQAMTGLRHGKSLGAFGWALLVCFGYGILHALGPGHGKSVVIAYFVGAGGSLTRGVRMGVQIALFHVLSSIVVVTLTDVAVRAATGGSGLSDFALVRQISYALIAAVGAWMLRNAVRSWRRAGLAHDHEHGSSDGAACAACPDLAPPGERGRTRTWLFLAVGAVPCTGALLVLLFGIANDALPSAILLVLAISAGLAITLSAIGIASIHGRNVADRRMAGRGSGVGASRGRFSEAMQIVAAVVVLAVGSLLLLLSLSSPELLPGGADLGAESSSSPL